VIPLYVINYIFDGDELSAADMKKPIETAMYSIHAIGAVFDNASKVMLLADPNGPLMNS